MIERWRSQIESKRHADRERRRRRRRAGNEGGKYYVSKLTQ